MISKPKKIKQINPNHDDRTNFIKLKKDLLKLGIVLDTDGIVYLMYFQDDAKNTKKHHHFLNFEKDRYTFQEIFEIGKRMANQKIRQNPKPKATKKKVAKKKSTKKTKKTSKTKRIVITGKRPTYRRIAGENAAGGFGAGFGIGAGHAFGDWLFD